MFQAGADTRPFAPAQLVLAAEVMAPAADNPKVIGASASWVDVGVAWVTDIRQAWAGPHTILFARTDPW